MKNKDIRLRFAPSPTGFLHIGNMRSALFGYLLSQSLGGSFILRIEDTDQKREVEGAVDSLLDVLDWVGIKFDEGPHVGGDYGPYIQSQRLDIYQKYTQELLDKGQAYHCFCSSERLEEMRQKQAAEKKPPKYDEYCRHLSREAVEEKIKQGESYVIRQKIPSNSCVEVYDELRGKIVFNTRDLDDQVLMKSNGVPTYQLASVVDDHLMKISHVTRGDEWLASFPKNILLYQSFGWASPKFIHLPLILNKGGGKLSKRQGDVFVEDYRRKGYLPEAIINFCALLGWRPQDEQELFTLDELKEKFSIEGLGVSPAVLDLEKLDYLNGYYIRQKSLEGLRKLCYPYLSQEGLVNNETDKDFIEKVLLISRERLKRLEDIASLSFYLFRDDFVYEEELLIWKDLSLDQVKNNLKEIYQVIDSINENAWQIESLEKKILSYLKDKGYKNGDFLWPLRVALSGQKNSPSPFELLWALGKERSLKRIERAMI
ncbi:MAG: glutamate--tRNA ligase [Patescibacteria group bacterium]|jgi:nondiscriminating glutamyl-tRNA synthetase|nr:glutamate--tRNA ligase [Patescibacteria group bacterium]